MSLFTQAKVFRNIKELEAFLVENGLRTPQINNTLDRLEEMLKGTDMGVRYDETPKPIKLSKAATELRDRVRAAETIGQRRKRGIPIVYTEEELKIQAKMEEDAYMEEMLNTSYTEEELEEDAKRLRESLEPYYKSLEQNPRYNTYTTKGVLPSRISYQEDKGKTTLVFGNIGYDKVHVVSATKDEKDKYCKTTGLVVALIKNLYSKVEARTLINTAYTRYPRNPKAFLEGAIASKLIMTQEEMNNLMKVAVTPGVHEINYIGRKHTLEVVE